MRWNCAYVESVKADSFDTADSTGDISLLPQPRPACAVARRQVRAGRLVRVRCTNVDGRVTVRLYKASSDRNVAVRARFRAGGKLAVPTKRRMRGLYRVALWRGGAVLGRFDVRLR